MFDIAPTELLVLGTVALLVIPPKDLPKAMRVAGYWVGRARGAARQFRAGFDNIIRESELQEMEKKWAAENERIMREFPPTPAMMALDAPPPPQEHSWPGLSAEEQPVLPIEPPTITPEPDNNGVVAPAAPVEDAPAPPKKPRARKKPADGTESGS